MPLPLFGLATICENWNPETLSPEGETGLTRPDADGLFTFWVVVRVYTLRVTDSCALSVWLVNEGSSGALLFERAIPSLYPCESYIAAEQTSVEIPDDRGRWLEIRLNDEHRIGRLRLLPGPT